MGPKSTAPTSLPRSKLDVCGKLYASSNVHLSSSVVCLPVNVGCSRQDIILLSSEVHIVRLSLGSQPVLRLTCLEIVDQQLVLFHNAGRPLIIPPRLIHKHPGDFVADLRQHKHSFVLYGDCYGRSSPAAGPQSTGSPPLQQHCEGCATCLPTQTHSSLDAIAALSRGTAGLQVWTHTPAKRRALVSQGPVPVCRQCESSFHDMP